MSSHNEQNEVESERNKAISLPTNMIKKCESPNMTAGQLKMVINSLQEMDRKLTVTENASTLKSNFVQRYKRKIEKQKRFFPKSKKSKED